jgi:ketosteroid isomerase-like protein
MHAHAALIERFYTAFAARDAAGMLACYHPKVAFSDPAFGELDAAAAGAMWTMLVGRATVLEVTFRDVSADDRAGRAHWTARYTFSRSGRRVANEIDAAFAFADGLIIRHDDVFDLWRWARQALGPVGLLLGWSPFLRRRIRAMALKGLASFRARGWTPTQVTGDG